MKRGNQDKQDYDGKEVSRQRNVTNIAGRIKTVRDRGGGAFSHQRSHDGGSDLSTTLLLIDAFIGWIGMNFGTDTNNAHMINSNCFGDPPTFPLAPSGGQTFHLLHQ